MTNDNLKKGISLIAFGFLFTLVNINLTLNGAALNITPDFIGWILLFLAHDKLGDYVNGKTWLKRVALILAIFSAAVWVYELARPELDTGPFKTVIGVTAAVYSFVLFGVLEQIALDHGSPRAGTIRTLKYVNVIAFAVFVFMALLGGNAGTLIGNSAAISVSGIAVFAGIVTLVAAVVTAVVLFLFRKEMNEKQDEQ